MDVFPVVKEGHSQGPTSTLNRCEPLDPVPSLAWRAYDSS